MSKNVWIIVLIIVVVGVGVWYFTSPSYRNANTNSAGTNANATQQFTTNTNASTKSEAGPDYAINMDEYSFTPSEIKVDLGDTVDVKVTNKGTTSHTFTISSLNVDSGLIAPGQSKTLTIAAPASAGTHQITCGVTGHKELGMTGSVVVQEL